MANFSQNQSVAGLGTTTINIPSAGRYCIQGKITLPTVQEGVQAQYGGGNVRG